MSESPELLNESYVLYDHVMNPLTTQQERKTRKNHGTRRGHHSTSSSSAFDQPSSSHLNDDEDDGNVKGTSRASTPSPTRFVNSLTNDVPQVFQNPPNIDPDMEPFYTRQTEIINRQVSPPSSNEPNSPQPLNPLLDNISDVPPRPLNPQPLKSHPSLDITLSLSPITPLDHVLDTPSPPSPPQPQPPIMSHPLYYNYHDYHGSTCICFMGEYVALIELQDALRALAFDINEHLLKRAGFYIKFIDAVWCEAVMSLNSCDEDETIRILAGDLLWSQPWRTCPL
ncbi:hypothetical protein Tco_0747531 [Tanacetum coccineum]|uniref:Uncharacterized protein n=1 Tax=Tanacetum coccineum TaxID=301880 RepID=A0ABQ4YTY7_9ASTR